MMANKQNKRASCPSDVPEVKQKLRSASSLSGIEVDDLHSVNTGGKAKEGEGKVEDDTLWRRGASSHVYDLRFREA